MNTDWGQAVVVDPRRLQSLASDVARLRRASYRHRLLASVLLASGAVAGVIAFWQSARIDRISQELRESRKTAARSSQALAALARSHDNILTATEKAPSVGTQSWGRRFTVTKYVPRSPAYGKDNDGITSTLIKADPDSRIVAVDPKLIPYHSWVWIEGLGWYRAEDCGGAIKGFRLDLLTATEKDAFAFGKQDRFVIVVPPTA